MRVPVRLLNAALRLTERRYLARETDIPRARARFERRAAMFFPRPRGMSRRDRTLGSRPAVEVVCGAAAPVGAILYLHGGAYCLGSPRTHERLGAALSARTGMTVVLPEYRLAPEHPFPAALDDCLGAFEALVDEGHDPARIVLAGDSAGGGLVLAILHELSARGGPWPGAAVAFSPVTDLTYSGESIALNRETEVFLPPNRMEEVRSWYLGPAAAAEDPRVSPLYGRFGSSTPVLLLASRSEMLLDDTLRMANRLTAQGVTTEVMTWDRTPHAWPLFQGLIAEADEALDATARFLRRHIGGDASPRR